MANLIKPRHCNFLSQKGECAVKNIKQATQYYDHAFDALNNSDMLPDKFKNHYSIKQLKQDFVAYMLKSNQSTAATRLGQQVENVFVPGLTQNEDFV